MYTTNVVLLKFKLNGKNIELEAEPEERLIDILRYKLHKTGTKESCGEGQCGACSVIVDGKLVLSCLLPAIKVQNSTVETIEALSQETTVPNYVQQAFIDVDAIQCGFCTPGLIMAVKSYIESGGENNTEKIKYALAGNICRCTGYENILKAVNLAFEYKNENKTN